MSLRHLKSHLGERTDQWKNWGGCWLYLELDTDDTVSRCIELYDSGVRLQYHRGHPKDDFGKLPASLEDAPLAVEQSDTQECTASEFEDLWRSGVWHNQEPIAIHAGQLLCSPGFLLLVAGMVFTLTFFFSSLSIAWLRGNQNIGGGTDLSGVASAVVFPAVFAAASAVVIFRLPGRKFWDGFFHHFG